MQLHLIIGCVLAAFAVQLILCVKAKRKIVKLIPAIVLVLGEVGFAVYYLVSSDRLGSSLILVIGGLLLLEQLAAVGFAWLVHHFLNASGKKKN